MSHTERLDELVDVSKPGLAEWVEREDARVDADREAQARLVDRGRWERLIAGCSDAAEVGADPFMRDGIIGPLIDSLTDHAAGDYDATAARRTRVAKVRDPNVKWGDEIEALRALASSRVQVRSGDIDRLTQRLSLRASVQSSTRNREPVVDPWLAATERALGKLAPADLELLEWVHVEFEPPAQRVTDDLSAGMEAVEVPIRILAELLGSNDERARAKETDAQIRKRLDVFGAWWRDGRKIRPGEATGRLPRGVPIEPARKSLSAMDMAKAGLLTRESKLQADGLRWEHLVAERLGLNVSGALGPLDPRKEDAKDPADGEPIERRMTWLEQSAREVRARHQAARRSLRERLLAVKLDTKPSYLIAAPTARELDRESTGGDAEVECCAGVHVENGLRAPCEVVMVGGNARRHPSKSWPRCGVCELPMVEVRA